MTATRAASEPFAPVTPPARARTRLASTDLLLIGITAAACAIRLFRLGHQSYWLDEAYTVMIVKSSFGHMLRTIPRTEKTPPLYYLFAWVWARVFGTGAFALRSVSAIAGKLTVPVAALTARRLFNARAEIFTAILVAVNPFLVYYSQEARSYSLLVLFSACALWAFVEAWKTGSNRSLVAWAIFATLALLTHYFAAFLLIPESIALIWRLRDRRAVLSSAAWVAVGITLLPLIFAQRNEGGFSFISAVPLHTRVVGIPHDFVVGSGTFPIHVLPGLAAAIVALGMLACVVLPNLRRHGVMLVFLAGMGVAVPTVLALGGLDYMLSRNELPILIPILIACGAGLAGLRPEIVALALLAISVGLALMVNGYYAYDKALQRDDWRSVAAELGPVGIPVVVSPGYETMPLSIYKPGLRSYASARYVREVDVVGRGRPPAYPPPNALVGFTLTQVIHTPSYEFLRYRSTTPRLVEPGQLEGSALGGEGEGAALVQLR